MRALPAILIYLFGVVIGLYAGSKAVSQLIIDDCEHVGAFHNGGTVYECRIKTKEGQ